MFDSVSCLGCAFLVLWFVCMSTCECIDFSVNHCVNNVIGILALIIIRTLRRDIARYNKDEEMV